MRRGGSREMANDPTYMRIRSRGAGHVEDKCSGGRRMRQFVLRLLNRRVQLQSVRVSLHALPVANAACAACAICGGGRVAVPASETLSTEKRRAHTQNEQGARAACRAGRATRCREQSRASCLKIRHAALCCHFRPAFGPGSPESEPHFREVLQI